MPAVESAAPSGRRVLIVDRDLRVRTALRALIHAAAPDTVIQDAATVAEVIDEAARQSPDVVVCDLLLPRVEDGLRLVRRLAADDGVAVVAMSASYRLRRRAIEAGARAFIDKGGTPEAVVEALMAVTPPQVTGSVQR